MYTYENWRLMMADLQLKNSDVAEITGTSENNIRKQISKTKKLPSWARAMIFVWKNRASE